MDETADRPECDQCPEAGHGGLEENVFPMLAEPGGHESTGEQDEQPGGNHVIGNAPSEQRHGLFSAALLKLLTTAARTGIVATYFGAFSHHRLLGFLMNFLMNGGLFFAIRPPAILFQEF